MKSIKIIALLLTLVMILTFAVSCGGNGDDTTTTTTSSSSESAGGEDQTPSDDEPEAEMIKVTFLNEDGTELLSQEVAKGENLEMPEAQQLKAKKFAGWVPEGSPSTLFPGMKFKVVKEMTFNATYTDVYPIDPVDYETAFVVPTGEMKTIYINPYVIDTTKPIVINFKVAQKGVTQGYQNAILRINNRDTLKCTSGYATFVLDDEPSNNQYPANGADTGWWGYKGDNYPDEKMQVRVTLNITENTIKFEVGRDVNSPNYGATLNRIDLSTEQIKIEFGYLITPELTISDLSFSYTTEDGVQVGN